MGQIEPGQNAINVPDDPLDLIEAFGPMSGMHAAMAARRIGMPCGLVACFQETEGDRVATAIEKAKRRFPLLNRRVSWINSRPMLVTADRTHRATDQSAISSLFDSGNDFWQYRTFQDGADAWLTAIWPHAMADGTSMLRFLETIAAIISDRPLSGYRDRSHRQVERQTMAGWLFRFVIAQHHRYVRPRQQQFEPGVAWCTLSPERASNSLKLAVSRERMLRLGLAAAACIALCEQEGVVKGRVLLNMQVERGSLQHTGGFGFGAGSLLMPVKINPSCALPALARHIHDRTKLMIDRGWNDNFERFLGSSPRRHHLFAALHARGQPTPIVSVSWKGRHWRLGRHDGLRDVACFAVSPAIHISGTCRSDRDVAKRHLQAISERTRRFSASISGSARRGDAGTHFEF